MRTLVIGIPLPDASFDNYSFISAPSIADYSRLIVDIELASRVVEEVVAGTGEHRTFAGQPVANQPSTGRTFALADLLEMRGREARRFFERGGTAVCFAYPDVAIPGIEGAPDFSRYRWLPEPEEFPYRTSLLPCFGKEQVTLDVSDHPFSGFIREFARRLAYHVCAGDEALTNAGGRPLGRTPGGNAVAFDIPVLGGSLLLLPPVIDYRDHRPQIAQTLLQGFESSRADEAPEWMRKEVS